MTTIDMVTDLGFAFVEAGDAAQALAALRRDPGIHVLLTDLGLPGMSGAQLVHEARKLKADIKVVAVSGYSEEAGGGRIDGAIYLQKPFTLEQLREVLLEGPPARPPI
jgi:CheY-like chemotaxis protein